MTTTAFIVDAVRTPIGRLGGALAAVRPDDLLACTFRALLDRVPGVDPARIDEVYAGDANGAGEDNRNVARMAALLAGLPVTVPGATMNRLCGSGMEAVIGSSRAIAVGDADVVLAGGVAANAALKGAMEDACSRRGMRCYIPPPSLCTDNAAMIGAAAYYLYQNNLCPSLPLRPEPS